MFGRIILLVFIATNFGCAWCSYVDIDVPYNNTCWWKSTTSRNALYCRRDASFYWDVLFDENVPEDGLKAYCCAHHQYFDCIKKLSKSQETKCNETEKQEILDRIYLQENNLTSLCDEKYKVGSWKCEMPLWGTALFFLAFLGGFGILAYVLFGVLGIQTNS